jgi:hypothetical protein
MATTFADRVPVWARPYAPISNYSNESFKIVPKVASLTESTQPQTVQNEFTVKFVAASPTVSSKKVLIDEGKPSVEQLVLNLREVVCDHIEQDSGNEDSLP